MPKIRLGNYCCQAGDKIIDQETFNQEDLIIAKRGNRTLVFSPLGNQPEAPVLALVGITPGGQSQVFADLLRYNSVEYSAKKAAFASGQEQIKELLEAHGFAKHIDVDLRGDLNDNPKIFTTSLVKCCLMVNGSYKYKAPDIVNTPEATTCVSSRFLADIDRYPTLRWVVIFGDPGWEAVTELRIRGRSVLSLLESRNIKVLNFPHFAQNFQQRAIFKLRPEKEPTYFEQNPKHRPYAGKARRLRSQVLSAMNCAHGV
jgi:hypothetical protein